MSQYPAEHPRYDYSIMTEVAERMPDETRAAFLGDAEIESIMAHNYGGLIPAGVVGANVIGFFDGLGHEQFAITFEFGVLGHARRLVAPERTRQADPATGRYHTFEPHYDTALVETSIPMFGGVLFALCQVWVPPNVMNAIGPMVGRAGNGSVGRFDARW